MYDSIQRNEKGREKRIFEVNKTKKINVDELLLFFEQ
jgi:hypothetical protein